MTLVSQTKSSAHSSSHLSYGRVAKFALPNLHAFFT